MKRPCCPDAPVIFPKCRRLVPLTRDSAITGLAAYAGVAEGMLDIWHLEFQHAMCTYLCTNFNQVEYDKRGFTIHRYTVPSSESSFYDLVCVAALYNTWCPILPFDRTFVMAGLTAAWIHLYLDGIDIALGDVADIFSIDRKHFRRLILDFTLNAGSLMGVLTSECDFDELEPSVCRSPRRLFVAQSCYERVENRLAYFASAANLPRHCFDSLDLI
jgi:hypothetical protein